MQKLGRNEKCYCKSGIKYKKCCMDKDSNTNKKPIHIQISDAMKNANIEECLYLDKVNCSDKIIKAHSLQNNKILNKLSENDKVLMRSAKMSEKGFEITMELIVRSKATTFTGFCGFHDNIVFQPIEKFKYTPNNLEQNALFAYRALAKEWHAKLVAKKLAEEFIAQNPNNQQMEDHLLGTELGLADIQKHVNVFKEILLEKKLDLLETQYMSFSNEYLLSVSSGISSPFDFDGGKLNHLTRNLDIPSKFLFLTIFPEDGKTHILLSYLKEDRDFYSFIKTQLLNKDEDTQKQKLSNLITINSENLVLAPSNWDKLEKSKQQLFLKIFRDNLSTLEKPETISSNHGFTLFN
jgi:hypothetical protein